VTGELASLAHQRDQFPERVVQVGKLTGLSRSHPQSDEHQNDY